MTPGQLSEGKMTSPRRGFLLGWSLILVGASLAHLVQTSGGITIEDVRFSTSSGRTLSALLYLPADATQQSRAPGILAVHGYINSREVQSGFAIEYARRGYVVLSLDQTGHGYSDPPAFADGFGGPAALSYLRSLDYVDTGNIGLEGHSMGGWAVLAAAAESPRGYSAMVLEGSSTGPPFAADGTPAWPRNVAVVFSLYDEFADLMWGTDRAADVGNSPKLQALFATDTKIEPGRVYGDVAAGSARILFQPPVTHPGDHISRTAIGHSLDWFAKTLEGGRPLPANDQIWPFKELGTLLALIGFVVLVLGTIRLLLHSGYFQPLNVRPPIAPHENRTLTWWLRAVFTAAVPVATFYLFFSWAESWLPPSAWFPQSITNQVMFWALANGVIVVAAGMLFPVRAVLSRPPMLSSLLLALITVATGYLAVFLADRFLLIDFRFWFVGMKALSLNQLKMAVIYLLPFTVYFIIILRALHGTMAVRSDSALSNYAANAFLLAGGFLIFLIAQYLSLFFSGSLLTPGAPLNTIVMIQFVPLMLAVSIIATFCYRRTGCYLPGAFVCSLLVTWYVVAGQATQFAPS
jgi:pimeloyl-ACP methyl ester carboxylesterase